MKFTTNLERYFFAKACQEHADKMFNLSMKKESQFPKGSDKNVMWHNSVNKYIHQSNFWAKVAERFEDAAFKGISKEMRIKLELNGMIQAKEA